ncbi:MAG: putative sulfate exporter family transporter [Halobacteriales archaeon]|nr:putative sulfate exporter family transporter [Halobacteriales archaeon]
MSRAVDAARRWLPGLGLLVAIALVAQLAAAPVRGLSPLLLAVAIGAVGVNLVGVPGWARPGADAHALLLEVGIVLLGARLALDELAAVGPRLLVLAVATVAAGLAVVEVLSRLSPSIDPTAGSLLAAGAGVCGVSAAAAVARSIDADESELAYAAGTVVLFDAITLVAFPAIGALLALPERTLGVWAGLAMFSTGPATAVGFAAGPTAGEFATLAKLARNSLIGVVAAAYAVAYGRSGAGSAGVGRTVIGALPRFLVGFVLVMAIANLGWLSPAALARVDLVADWAFLLAFAGLGLSLRLAPLRETGLAPVAVVGASLASVGTLALLAAMAWF